MPKDYHKPVMVREVLEYLDVQPGGRYVDGTAGGGGHSEAIVEASSPDGRLLGIDRDPEAIASAAERLSDRSDRVQFVRGNYADAPDIVAREQFGPVDGFLVDAGVSSHQIDTAERGFSIRFEGPLDMRMGPEAERLDTFLERVPSERLSRVLSDYGEIRGSRRIAGAISEAMEEGELETTAELAEVVREAAPQTRSGTDPATLVFQALRIAVNDELSHLERAVEQIPDWIPSGGRAVFISFHSLEDRIVKHGLRRLARDCVCPPDMPVCGCDEESRVEVLTASPVRPSEEEESQNPRARSALLRAARIR